MQIQSINRFQSSNNFNGCKKSKKVNSQTNFITFKGDYGKVMCDVLKRDLLSISDVKKAMYDLFLALTKENEITTTPLKTTLSDWFNFRGTELVTELCKPIAKVRSELRDIIFDSKEVNLPLVKKSDDDLLYIMNFGKHGFWNSIFESESANNDMRIIFTSDAGMFEVRTNSKGNIETEQCLLSGYWRKNIYDNITENRIKQETGDSSETIIIPQF